MFGPPERRRSSNVRFKQLFHELKQQFPTISDDEIANCIFSFASTSPKLKNAAIIEALKASSNGRRISEESMGRPSSTSLSKNLVVDPKVDSVSASSNVSESNENAQNSSKTLTYDLPKLSTKLTPSTYFSQPGHISSEINRFSSIKSKKGSISLGSESKNQHSLSPVKRIQDISSNFIKGLPQSSFLKKPRSYGNSPKSESPYSTKDSNSSANDQIVDHEKLEDKDSNSLEKIGNDQVVDRESSKDEGSFVVAVEEEYPKSLQFPSNRSDHENVIEKNLIKTSTAKRPTTLSFCSSKTDARTFKTTQDFATSEKAKNLPKLLNSNVLCDKPPRSPVHGKKIVACKAKKSEEESEVSALKSKKKETVSTPTQTTDTLLGGENSVNLCLNVNCSMDLIQSPRRATFSDDPRDSEAPQVHYTSLNFTLEPNEEREDRGLTYSSSCFDSKKRLQSRVHITVGPGARVTAMRTRPRSCEFDRKSQKVEVPVKSGSTNNLVTVGESPVILKQQARIEKLRIELRHEKTRLLILKREIIELKTKTAPRRNFKEIQRKELKLKIDHLRLQCDCLVQELDKSSFDQEFYPNIYRGQQGPLDLTRTRQSSHRDRLNYQDDFEGPKWNCHMCTFLNHPELDKCEQCEMPRILHVSAAPGDNIHIHVTPRLTRRIVQSWLL